MVEVIDLTLWDDGEDDKELQAKISRQIQDKVREIKSQILHAVTPYNQSYEQISCKRRRTRFGGFDQEFLSLPSPPKDELQEVPAASPYSTPTLSPQVLSTHQIVTEIVQPTSVIPVVGDSVASKKRSRSRFGAYDENFLAEEKQAAVHSNMEGCFTPITAMSISSPTNSFDSNDDDHDQFHIVIHQDDDSDSDGAQSQSFFMPRTPVASTVGQRSPALSTANYFMDDTRSVFSHSFSIQTDYTHSILDVTKCKQHKLVHFDDAQNGCRLYQEFQPSTGSMFAKDFDKLILIAREQLDKFITGGRDSTKQQELTTMDEDEVSFRIHLANSTKTRYQQDVMHFLHKHRNKSVPDLNPCQLQLVSYDKVQTGRHIFPSECKIKPIINSKTSSITQPSSSADLKTSTATTTLSNYELVLMVEKKPGVDPVKQSLHGLCRSPIYLGIVDAEHWLHYNLFPDSWETSSRGIHFEEALFRYLQASRKTQRNAKSFTCIPLVSCSWYLRTLHVVQQLSTWSITPYVLIGARSITTSRLKEFMAMLRLAAYPVNKKASKLAQILKVLRNLQAVPMDVQILQALDSDKNVIKESMKTLEEIGDLHLSLDIDHALQEMLLKFRQLLRTPTKKTPEEIELQNYAPPVETVDYISAIVSGATNGQDESQRLVEGLATVVRSECSLGMLHDVTCFHGSNRQSVEMFVKMLIQVLVKIRKDIKYRKLQRQTILVVAVDHEDTLQALTASLMRSTAPPSPNTNTNTGIPAKTSSSSSSTVHIANDVDTTVDTAVASSCSAESIVAPPPAAALPRRTLKILALREEFDKKVNHAAVVRKHDHELLNLHQQCRQYPEITTEMKDALEHRDDAEYWASREARSDALVAYQAAKWKLSAIRNQARLDILASTQVILATCEELSEPSFVKFMEENANVVQCPTVISVITKADILEGSCLLPLAFNTKKWIVVEQTSSTTSINSSAERRHCAMVQRWKALGIQSTCIDTKATIAAGFDQVKAAPLSTAVRTVTNKDPPSKISPTEDSKPKTVPRSLSQPKPKPKTIPKPKPPSPPAQIRKNAPRKTEQVRSKRMIVDSEDEEFQEDIHDQPRQQRPAQPQPAQPDKPLPSEGRQRRVVQAPIKYRDNNAANDRRLLTEFDQVDTKVKATKSNTKSSIVSSSLS